jgi:CheY-like chemotaxis protein
LRILVVDDEAVNRRICLRMLNKLGCTAEALEDGDQVLPRLLRDAGGVSPYDSRQVFDVILMDIMMQRTNVSGVNSCNKITLPCVALS